MLNIDSETTWKHIWSEKLGKSRHMLPRHEDLVDRVKQGEVYVRTMKGINNKSDAMTKQLVGKTAIKHSYGLLGHALVENYDVRGAIKKSE
jgi:hypothetical protein